MRVEQLWRFPVKSMGGDTVDQVRIDARGMHADRLWAVRDLENDITASARRIPALLGCSARYAEEPGPDAGPGNVPDVVITFPGGDEMFSADPRIHRRLAELVDRDVRLTPLAPVDDTDLHRLSVRQSKANFAQAEVRSDFGLGPSEALPDTSVFTTRQILTLARFSTPPGTFVDLSAIHLMSVTSLESLSPDGGGYDVRRFRPNVLVTVDEPADDFPEGAWVGATVEIGAARVRVSVPTIRCVVPTRPQPGVDLDRAITRRLAERTNRFLGVYADVTGAGVVRAGDPVKVHHAAPPGAVRSTAAAVSKTVLRQVQRVVERTLLR
ncbi:MOSC domain-containing protein [Mycolicibacterium sediminis]|uniref:Molybdenum cofactor biosysynthesis protein n=1 Tax=Mycolicibacterium sediminis TaxID=1286180 RepID=A0A7I7QJS1_9MYCO|nr:MOSC N-terminal beta barrel domain-containing protein [Mycolicibacterium sediminis]BBY26558.1 molybdenum cofactor biosysynthesis protein [Mycolicibacterium sediminis]